MADLDPWLAFALGAATATVVAAVAAGLWWWPRRARLRDAPEPPAPVEVPVEDTATSGLADLVPLVVAPVQLLTEIVRVAVPEVRGLFAPGGQVALLFSDVVSSTEANARLGDDAWSSLVAAHDRVTDTIVKRHRGRVVKRQGDGLMAAFHTAHEAVAAAVELQPALTDAGGELAQLRLRVGVHVGEVVSRAGDYFGVNVATAARVAAAARPGEVLVTGAVVEALGEHGTSWQLRPRPKPVRLPGLQGEHRLSAVRV